MYRTTQITQKPPLTKKKNNYKSGAHLFFSFFWKNPLILSVAIILAFFQSMLTLIPSIIIGRSVDILETTGYGTLFIQSALLILAVAIINYFISFSASYTFGIASIAFERDLRQEYFDAIQSHSLTFHNENNSSKLLSLGMTEIQLIRHAIMPSASMIIRAFFSIILLVFYITYFQLVDINLASIIGIGFVIYFILAYSYAKKVGPVRKELSNSVGNVTEQSQEIFRGIEVVRSLSSQQKETERFNKLSQEFAEISKKEGRLSAFYWPGLLLLILTGIVFTVLLFDVKSGKIEIGDLIQVIGLLLTLQFINFTMPMALLELRAAIINSNRVLEKMNWKDPLPIKEEIVDHKINWKGSIEFENVSFSYGGEFNNAIQNVSFKIPANSKVALIGGPGSGKTTIMKLLLNLYQPQKGHIKIDGVNYDNLYSSDIRRHVSMVEQEVFLFSGSIKENISFTKEDASDEELIEAAKAAQAYEFIENMSDGLDTIIGERGVTLSGGQRQRIAIARAILANPEVLLLDDSSSALDSKTELLIRKALENLSYNRLTITVTQRLSTLITADLIILMHKGEVAGIGNHETLYANNDRYRTIFQLLPEAEKLFAEKQHIANTQGGNE
ncbi:MAG: ABC transporter ATP-binding protein/permease [Candidatus Heimdallarchaeota archaeon]|nr:ABC transporter ATP-binding protein/permease [Candidatus Heimdallarchaeota archaeon]MDH5645258.1 ABC transporter ATP-binding protein/permease [Candidatus Heimdallarchaeota archaeon]